MPLEGHLNASHPPVQTPAAVTQASRQPGPPIRVAMLAGHGDRHRSTGSTLRPPSSTWAHATPTSPPVNRIRLEHPSGSEQWRSQRSRMVSQQTRWRTMTTSRSPPRPLRLSPSLHPPSLPPHASSPRAHGPCVGIRHLPVLHTRSQSVDAYKLTHSTQCLLVAGAHPQGSVVSLWRSGDARWQQACGHRLPERAP